MLNQFASLSLADQKAMLSALRAEYLKGKADAKAFREQERITRESVKADRAAARLEKQQAKALKQEQAIMKAQLRLEKLLAKQAAPVGAKAVKANKRPSKVVTYGAEDNAIAATIMAKKVTV